MSETLNNVESYLVSLCRKAEDWGASQAIPIPIADMVVDERANLKCMVPICPHYGVDLMCPPNVLPASKFKEVLTLYRSAVLIKVKIPLSSSTGDTVEQKEQSESPGVTYRNVLKENKKKLTEIVGRIESLCISEGYTFAAGLTGGSCPLCEQCVGVKSGLPCRHPFRARPSMEAMGIDVITTARKAGINVDFQQGGDRSWIGLVLVD